MLIGEYDGVITASQREAPVIRYRILLPDGSVRFHNWEVFAWTVWAPDVPAVSGGSVWVPDVDELGGAHEMRLASGTFDALAGKDGALWKLVEVLPGGIEDPRYKGPLKVLRSPAVTGVAPPEEGEGEILMLFDEEND